ncbi:MAG TPA: hypothetical protein H9684_03620 [Firmicutes bacterium]|nr:hypothetical protein [Bacillota bacterium]
MADTFYVSLTPENAARAIDSAIVEGSITGERIDYYTLRAPGETYCIVCVYEKHYYRAGNRLTLTATIDNFDGRTRVVCISGGGGEGLFRFDWGASDSFINVVRNALEPYTA